MYNYPLTVHGADLRANNPGTNQNCTDANGNSFVLKRSDINKTGGYFGFVIEDGGIGYAAGGLSFGLLQ